MNTKYTHEFKKYKYFLIVDLEATCCNKNTITRNQMEIIEIGAVMLDSETLLKVDEFTIFIKPIRHPILTDFCKDLTSITQKDIDTSLKFPESIKIFKKWLYQYDNFLFCSWGDYDKKQLDQDCKHHYVPNPIGAEHINIKKLFSKSQNLKKKYGMAGALKLSKIKLEGFHHRGIDDARNMANLMPYILGCKSI